MKDIKLFKTRKEYENFVWGEIFTEELIARHPFYRNLIQFVMDARAPIFYYQSDPSEHANFSTYYNFDLIRETYANKTLRSMYFLHDFVHSLFYYPYDMSSVSQEEFNDAIILGEYSASNETEILVHYRIPELRAKVFQDRKIFFDILKDRGVSMLGVQSLFQTRKLIIENDFLDPFFFVKPEDKPIRDLFKTYRGSRAWCKERYEASLKIINPTEYFYEFLTPMNYERVIMSYNRGKHKEEEYQRIVLMNIKLAFTVLGFENPPQSFRECFEKLSFLEGQVMFKK